MVKKSKSSKRLTLDSTESPKKRKTDKPIVATPEVLVESSSVADTPSADTKQKPEKPEKASVIASAPLKTDSKTSGTLDAGKYNEETKEWSVELSSTTKMRVMRFKGVTYVDIRKMWNDKPTGKGICLPIDLFRQIQTWDKLDEAQNIVENNNR